MIFKYVKVLVGNQEQLTALIGKHPPFDRVGVISAASVAALLISTEINVIRLSAADICGSSAVCKLDCLSCVCCCRKRYNGHKPRRKAKHKEQTDNFEFWFHVAKTSS